MIPAGYMNVRSKGKKILSGSSLSCVEMGTTLPPDDEGPGYLLVFSFLQAASFFLGWVRRAKVYEGKKTHPSTCPSTRSVSVDRAGRLLHVVVGFLGLSSAVRLLFRDECHLQLFEDVGP